MVDYLYVSEEEQKTYNKRRKALLEQYHILANGICRDLAKAVVAELAANKDSEDIRLGLENRDIATAIDLEVAKQFLDETKFIVPSFFEAEDPDFFIGGDDYDADHFYLNTGDQTWLYAKHNQEDSYGRGGWGQKNLEFHRSNYMEVKDRPGEVLGLLVFTFCFSKKHEKLLEGYPELKEAAATFYYLLKTAQPQPQISDDAVGEVRDEVKYQSALEPIFKGKIPLLGEYEQLDTLHRKFAYDPEAVKKKRAEKNYSFKALKASEEMPAVYCDKDITAPATIINKTADLLGGSDLAERLKCYRDVDPFGADPTGFYYCRTLMNVAAMLMDPEQPLDDKTRLLSPFNDANKAVMQLCKHIGETQLKLDEETTLRLHDEKAKAYYLDALFMYVAHAYTEKPAAKFPGAKKGSWFELLINPGDKDNGRRTNVQAFMAAFAAEGANPAPQFEKVLDNNFDKGLTLKTESEKIYECLKKLNGVSSYVDKADGVMNQTIKTKKGLGSNKRTSEDLTRRLKDYKKSPKYQKLLVGTKTLGFFMAAANIAEFVQGRQRLDLPNLTGFVGDLLSVSRQMGDLIPKALQASSPEAKAAAKAVKSLPESVEHLLKVDKISSASHMKVLTRFGLVGVMAGAVNDIATMDLENNRDYTVATLTKNGIYLALLLVPGAGWAGAAGLTAIATLELVWYFASENIHNSSLELYLYKSLLFNASKHNENRSFNEQEYDPDYPYTASTLLDTLKSSGGRYTIGKQPTEAAKLKGFMSIDGLRTFIAENYRTCPHTFDAALANELALLKASLYGYKLETETSDRDMRLGARGMEFSVHSYEKVQLSKNLFDESETVWLVQDGTYTDLGKMRSYDIVPYSLERSGTFDKRAAEYLSNYDPAAAMGNIDKGVLVGDILKDVKLIVVSKQAIVKFAVECNTMTDGANAEVHIGGFKIEGMSEEDYKHVKKDANA
jgi:hypothetical protein